MRNYVTLDGYKYKTQNANWVETEVNPRQVTRLASGKGDVTFGPLTYFIWVGTLTAPVSAPTGWGTKATLAATYKKKTVLAYEDHLGVSYSVAIGSKMEKRSKLPEWDNADNDFYVFVEIVSL